MPFALGKSLAGEWLDVGQGVEVEMPRGPSGGCYFSHTYFVHHTRLTMNQIIRVWYMATSELAVAIRYTGPRYSVSPR